MRRIRVAHVITRLCKGGAQENTVHTVRLANQKRYQVDLISGPTTGEEGSIEPLVGKAGIGISREPNLKREVDPLADLRAYTSLLRRFRETPYDIVHTHTSKAGILGRAAAKRAGIPIIVHTPHGNIFDGYFPRWKTKLYVRAERAAARWSDRLIELTTSGVEEYLAQGIGHRDQYTVIFSGIDLEPYERALRQRETARAELGVKPGEFLVGGVGRLEPIKGFTYFIDAAQRIAQEIPGVRFVHAGQGSLERGLRDRAKAMNSRFLFLGPRSDVPRLMAAMDVLVVPSINEGMGRVILEAGAAGTPVVASKVGGVPDVVQHDATGMLVAPKSPGDISDAVIGLCREPEKLSAMGRAARSFVQPAFSLEEMVMRIESMYEELVQEKSIDT